MEDWRPAVHGIGKSQTQLATDQQQSDVSMLLLLGETKSSTKNKECLKPTCRLGVYFLDIGTFVPGPYLQS